MFSFVIGLIGAILSLLGYFAFNSQTLIIIGGLLCVFELIIGLLSGQLKSVLFDVVIAIIGVFLSKRLGLTPVAGALFFVSIGVLITSIIGIIMLFIAIRKIDE